jgi:hypothetical protein
MNLSWSGPVIPSATDLDERRGRVRIATGIVVDGVDADQARAVDVETAAAKL